jgi:hypothetical protein
MLALEGEAQMLRSVQDLEGYAIRAADGVIGHIKDIHFDDHNWVVRYFVVETGSWLSSRKVLISPIAIGKPDWAARVLPVPITKEQVKGSPDIDMLTDVGHTGRGADYLVAQSNDDRVEAAEERLQENSDLYVRSCNALLGYHIQANDGGMGQVKGLMVDE